MGGFTGQMEARRTEENPLLVVSRRENKEAGGLTMGLRMDILRV
jgi:hypothetical protein